MLRKASIDTPGALHRVIFRVLEALDAYKYGGHSTLMGKMVREWQDVSFVLGHFSKRSSQARRYYREFVEKGLDRGHRPDLTGGGLIRSLGGWSALKMIRGSSARIKSDERILGDGDFVERLLEQAREHLESR